METDAELLRRFVKDRSDAAFAELVRRRIDLVFSVARRQVGGDAHLAEDVTQNVFVDLARKAPSLVGHGVLSGWLCRSAHFAASDVVRSERRRRAREETSGFMQEITGNDGGSPPDWERLRPWLDEALSVLAEADRDAVALRFIEEKSFAEVGTRLAISEEAARKRVDRALARLETHLARRGVTSTMTAIAMALAGQGAVAAPAGLAATVTGAALAATPATVASIGWMTFLMMNKGKMTVLGLLLLAALVPTLNDLFANRALRSELQALQAEDAAAQGENRRLLASLAAVGAAETIPNETDDLGRLRARAARLRARPDGVVEAEMKPPANAGYATPAAAFETLSWASVTGDWETFARAWAFRGETKEQADAFFAGLNPEARARFGTPERALAHGLITGSFPGGAGRLWMTDMQIVDSEIVDGPAPMKVRLWRRPAAGEERMEEILFERGGDGWVIGQGGADKMVKGLLRYLDPKSGLVRPAKR